jgi:predicted RNA binding protein YcfA (HicA-like mRNA interferase family)
MPKLPGVSQKDAVRVFAKLGYRVARESGHVILSNGKERQKRARYSAAQSD